MVGFMPETDIAWRFNDLVGSGERLRKSAGRGFRRPAGTSILRYAIAAQGPHIHFALRYGLVHARASAGIRNATPG